MSATHIPVVDSHDPDGDSEGAPTVPRAQELVQAGLAVWVKKFHEYERSGMFLIDNSLRFFTAIAALEDLQCGHGGQGTVQSFPLAGVITYRSKIVSLKFSCFF